MSVFWLALLQIECDCTVMKLVHPLHAFNACILPIQYSMRLLNKPYHSHKSCTYTSTCTVYVCRSVITYVHIRTLCKQTPPPPSMLTHLLFSSVSTQRNGCFHVPSTLHQGVPGFDQGRRANVFHAPVLGVPANVISNHLLSLMPLQLQEVKWSPIFVSIVLIVANSIVHLFWHIANFYSFLQTIRPQHTGLRAKGIVQISHFGEMAFLGILMQQEGGWQQSAT